MGESAVGTERHLLDHVLVPVATPDDALNTARALEPYGPGQVTATHVVEKGGGVPDKTPVEQSHAIAEECYEQVRTVFPQADDHTAYGRNVVETIYDAADAVDATAIAYVPRGGGRIVQFISGDTSLKLVTDADRPVIALHSLEDE